MDNLLEINNLTVKYKRQNNGIISSAANEISTVTAVNNISLSVKKVKKPLKLLRFSLGKM